MNSKPKIKLSTPVVSSETQRQVNRLQKALLFIQQREGYRTEHVFIDKSAENSSKLRIEGNDLLKQTGHDVDIHRKILTKYSECIAFAPIDSEELVLGYGNRSVLLMHLELYKEALVDIDRAFELSKSDDYKKKMQARKDKCLGLLNQQNLIKSTKNMTLNEIEELEKIRPIVENFIPSTRVAGGADCVEVAYNSQVGRCLVATRDIKPGETVMVQEGYVSAQIMIRLYIVCSHCLDYAFNGIPCDKCVFAIYCSEECKNEALKEYHDIECKMFKYMWNTVLADEEPGVCTSQGTQRMAAMRILIKALKNEGFEIVMKEISEEKSPDSYEVLLTDGILKSDFKACYNLLPWKKDVGRDYEKLEAHTYLMICFLVEHTDILVSHMSKNPMADKNEINLYKPVFHDDGSITVDPRMLLKLREALMKLKFICFSNQHEFESASRQCGYCKNWTEHVKICKYIKGYIIVPSCSLINHSCTFNVRYLSVSKRKALLFSVCPIKKGEMLCSSYHSISIFDGNVKDRELALKKFSCKCKACLDNIYRCMFMNDYDIDNRKIEKILKKHVPASMAKSYIEPTVDFNDYEISEKTFHHIIKISQSLYNNFEYYKAFAHNPKCSAYFETVFAKLYKDKVFMPNDC